ncbi:protein of unknown function [Nitrospina watsonii]|uniref:Uncharacterized protein n=1 Tax=Nitrospina watsonii TaxID=1323948 RepID=A0ABN8VY26_9BACT|nr:protein of unknown function [Nitrospina watsonii]
MPGENHYTYSKKNKTFIHFHPPARAIHL